MGIYVNASWLAAKAGVIDNRLLTVREKIAGCISAINNLAEDGSLSGMGYEKAKSYFSQYFPVLNELSVQATVLTAANGAMKAALGACPHLGSAREDELLDEIDWLNERVKQYQRQYNSAYNRYYPDSEGVYHRSPNYTVMDYAERMKIAAQRQIREDQTILEELRTFNSSGAVYGGVQADLEALQKCVLEICEPIGYTINYFDSRIEAARLEQLLRRIDNLHQFEEKYAGEELEALDTEESKRIKRTVELLEKNIRNFLPALSVGQELEVPIAPGVIFYFKSKITGNADADGEIELTQIANAQMELLIDSSIAGKIDDLLTFSAEGLPSDPNIAVEVDGKQFIGKINTSGELEFSNVYVDGNNTYTSSIIAGINDLAIEESIETEISNGSCSTTVGIQITDNRELVPEPIPVEAENHVHVELPHLDSVDWKEVGKDVAISVGVVATGVLIGAFIYFTGGTGALVFI